MVGGRATITYVRKRDFLFLAMASETMQRSIFTLTATCLLLATTSEGAVQGWARQMFTTTSHDFGTVALAAKAGAFGLVHIKGKGTNEEGLGHKR